MLLLLKSSLHDMIDKHFMFSRLFSNLNFENNDIYLILPIFWNFSSDMLNPELPSLFPVSNLQIEMIDSAHVINGDLVDCKLRQTLILKKNQNNFSNLLPKL